MDKAPWCPKVPSEGSAWMEAPIEGAPAAWALNRGRAGVEGGRRLGSCPPLPYLCVLCCGAGAVRPRYSAQHLGGPQMLHWKSRQKTRLSQQSRGSLSLAGARLPGLGPTPAPGTHSLPAAHTTSLSFSKPDSPSDEGLLKSRGDFPPPFPQTHSPSSSDISLSIASEPPPAWVTSLPAARL